MNNKILVTYASRSGTTAGVAEAIGKTLNECGSEVDIRPMSEVEDLSPYWAVVAGSAIQGKQWLPEAMAFLQENRVELNQKPFAAFLVCMTLTMKNGGYQDFVAEWLQPVRAIVKPVSEGYFAGSLDISKVPTLKDKIGFRISVMTGVWTEGDHRNWDEIRNWAMSLSAKLHL